MASRTAEVVEFRCQYTHHVSQKKKKWNDGSLKFHTFNKLIRLFDDFSNQIGQKHWQGSELQDGDEFMLDDHVLVRVEDQLRSTQTDLTPLFERRKQTPNPARSMPRISNAPQASGPVTIATALATGSNVRPSQSSSAVSSKHKSLTSLLGTLRGPQGKALPPKSPFESRRNNIEGGDWDEPCAKRQRTGEDGRNASWTLTSTSKHSTARPARHSAKDRLPDPASRSLVKKLAAKTPPGQRTLNVKRVIDLTSSPPEVSQSNDRPADPAIEPPLRTAHSVGNSVPFKSNGLRSSSPPVRASNTVHHVDQTLDIGHQDRHPGRRSESDAAPRRLANDENTVHNHRDKDTSSEQNTRTQHSPLAPVDANPRIKPLRLKSQPSKRTLLCMLGSGPDTSRKKGESSKHANGSDNDNEVLEITREALSRPERASVTDHCLIQGDSVRAPEDDRHAVDSRTSRATGHSVSDLRQNAHESIVITEDIADVFSSSPAFEDVSEDPDFPAIGLDEMLEQLATPRVSMPKPSPGRNTFRRAHSDSDATSSRTATLAAANGAAHTRTAFSRVISGGVTGPVAAQPSNITAQQRHRTSLRRVQTHAADVSAFRPPFQISLVEEEEEETPVDVGPWSREAFDLFDWRPPNWEERLAKMPSTVAMVD